MQESKNSKSQKYLPIFLSLIFAFGILVGLRLSNKYNEKTQSILKITDMGFNKMNEIINYIEQEYVDTMNRELLIDKTINSLLQELDPHSYYISPEEFSDVNDPLEGNFDGIGIEFTIQNDTVMVISPIAGGPSELAGIKAGDRIINVNKENIAGVGITNKKIMLLLKGKSGTAVEISILRPQQGKKTFMITRDKIPLHSLDAAYMIQDTVGYIKLSRFSKTTYQEFMDEAMNLKALGMKKLILDLRNNGGGFLDEAVKIADEFLKKGHVILFTEGKARPKKYYKSTKVGEFENMGLCILIDEGTASASEIISGAIQDNDRGLIIGRRSYGKGLVQEQSNWPDGSAIRLTIARYYTPSGRSIQKPYNHGSKNYHLEQDHRIQSIDSKIDTADFPDSLKHFTRAGRIVYGGGGIYPDLYVPYDTTDRTMYLVELYYSGILRDYAIDYVDKNRHHLENTYPSHLAFSQNFNVDQKQFNGLIDFAVQKGLKSNSAEIKISRHWIEHYLKSNIGRYLYGNNGFYSSYNLTDPVIKEALSMPSYVPKD